MLRNWLAVTMVAAMACSATEVMPSMSRRRFQCKRSVREYCILMKYVRPRPLCARGQAEREAEAAVAQRWHDVK